LTNGWKTKHQKQEILEDLEERWQQQTGGNAIFISALERTNIDALAKGDPG
jgi:GTP-binding protein HflX